MTSPGLGSSLTVTSVTTAYDVTFINWSFLSLSFQGANVPTTGSVSVAVVFPTVGPADPSARYRLGSTAVEATVWVSSSSVLAKAAAGGLARPLVALSASPRQATTLSRTVSFDAFVTIRATGGASLSGTGASSVTIVGPSLGPQDLSARGRVGTTGCVATVWAPTSAMTCKGGAGAGARLTLCVTVDRPRLGLSSASQAASYETGGAPIIATPSNGPTTGSVSLTIATTPSATVSMSPRVRVARSGCVATAWVQLTAVQCKSGAGSVSESREIIVTMSRSRGSVDAAYSYGPRAALQKGGGQSNAAVTGGTSVVIGGAELGAASPSPRGRVGESAAQGTVWASGSAIQVKAGPWTAGSCGGREVVVTVSGPASLPPMTLSRAASYDGAGLAMTLLSKTIAYGILAMGEAQ